MLDKQVVVHILMLVLTPTATYTLYNAEGTATGTFSGSGGTPIPTGAILSQP